MNIGVVGAGISGLAAAGILRDAGHQVRIFEKARGPGGRMATRRHGDLRFDHGAQYFTVSDPRFRRHVEDWTRDGLIRLWPGRVAISASGRLEPHPRDQVRHVSVPRMSALTRHLSEGLDAVYGATVTAMRRSEHGWYLAVQDVEEGPFDAVILTTPPEQAVPLLPPSPLAEMAGRVQMLPCWALMIAFEEPLAVDYDAVFVNEGPLSWAARDSSKPGRSGTESWVVHASHAWSKEHLEHDKDAVGRLLTDAFFDALRLEPSDPLHSETHRWRFAKAANPLSEECLWDPESNVVVGGDWTNGGNVEGAFLSGVAAAGVLTEG